MTSSSFAPNYSELLRRTSGQIVVLPRVASAPAVPDENFSLDKALHRLRGGLGGDADGICQRLRRDLAVPGGHLCGGLPGGRARALSARRARPRGRRRRDIKRQLKSYSKARAKGPTVGSRTDGGRARSCHATRACHCPRGP